MSLLSSLIDNSCQTANYRVQADMIFLEFPMGMRKVLHASLLHKTTRCNVSYGSHSRIGRLLLPRTQLILMDSNFWRSAGKSSLICILFGIHGYCL